MCAYCDSYLRLLERCYFGNLVEISFKSNPFFFNVFVCLFVFINLFTYFWLCWVLASVRGLSPVAASGGHSSSRCAGLSLSRPLLLRSTGSRRAGSVVVARGPSRSTACGILPDQSSNPCPLHWQADSHPLRHQGSPKSNPFKGSRERGLPVVTGAGPKPGHPDFIISAFDAAVAGSAQKTGSETDLHARNILGIYWAVPWGLAQSRAEGGVTYSALKMQR